MKEKVRLENELNTAKLVQKSFFPTNMIEGEHFKLNAFYKPASECGGDWWGYLKFEQSEVVILIDVTGHGTAAALLTAVIHNSLTALKYIAKNDDSYKTDPTKIMNFLNESFCAVDINLNATAFVLVCSKNKLSYANASHNPPYFIKRKTDETYSKQDFIPLMEKSGARLGENLDSIYETVNIDCSSRDHLILYTDGILEAENDEEKAYGTRNFVKSFSQSLNFSNQECLENAKDDFYTFLGERDAGDDVSLIKMEFKF